MKIYFAGSITGGREDVELYSKIINILKTLGVVLTEHVGDSRLSVEKGENLSDGQIHDRDVRWIVESDVIIAEVSTPSLGVGYEIRTAIQNRKSILCLYRPEKVKRLSAMIRGSPDLTVKEYHNLNEARQIIDEFLRKL